MICFDSLKDPDHKSHFLINRPPQCVYFGGAERNDNSKKDASSFYYLAVLSLFIIQFKLQTHTHNLGVYDFFHHGCVHSAVAKSSAGNLLLIRSS